MESISVWTDAHPVVMALLIWPLVSAILVFLCTPRTEEEYARMNPRLAATLKLIAALGIDPLKALEALQQITERRKK
jgi:hypothetical protein